MKILLPLTLLFFSLSNAQWERVPDIPATRTVYSLITEHDTLYAGTDSVVYVGVNAGTQWFTGAPPGDTNSFVGCLLKHNNILFAGTFKKGVFKSSDNGLSWQPFNTGLSGLGATDISNLLVRRDSLIAGTLGAGVFITAADLSHSWSSWSDSIIDYEGDNVYKMQTVGNTVLASAGGNGYMFRYSDAQPWWNPISINIPRLVGQFVWAIENGTAVTVAVTSSGIFRSTDEGLSWERASFELPSPTFRMLLAYHGTNFFSLLSTPFYSTLLLSTDEGVTWNSLGDFPLFNMFAIAIDNEILYLGGAGGVLRTPLSGLITSVSEEKHRPVTFNLSQNYPNPFNPSTTISFTLPSRSMVSLKVFDVMGRDVATIASDEMPAGSYTKQWNAEHFSSGVYFYRLQAGNYVETKKLLLMK